MERCTVRKCHGLLSIYYKKLLINNLLIVSFWVSFLKEISNDMSLAWRRSCPSRKSESSHLKSPNLSNLPLWTGKLARVQGQGRGRDSGTVVPNPRTLSLPWLTRACRRPSSENAVLSVWCGLALGIRSGVWWSSSRHDRWVQQIENVFLLTVSLSLSVHAF